MTLAELIQKIEAYWADSIYAKKPLDYNEVRLYGSIADGPIDRADFYGATCGTYVDVYLYENQDESC